MSIVHFLLLKTVIDEAKDSKYFIPGILMISIAIVLQVTVGFLALRVNLLNKFYKKFNDHLGDEDHCLKACRKDEDVEKGVDIECVFKLLENDKLTDLFDVIKEIQAGDPPTNVVPKDGSTSTKTPKDDHPPNDGPKDGSTCTNDGSNAPHMTNPNSCCTCCCTSQKNNKVNVLHSQRLVEWYEIWQVLMEVCELRAIGAQEEAKAIKLQIEHHERELDRIGESLKKTDIKPARKDRLTDRKKVLETEEIPADRKHLSLKRKENKRDDRWHASLKKQGECLQEYMDAVTRERVYKSSSEWQRKINYILYTVFILNAAIVAFGMTGAYVSPAEPTTAP